jgi:hypothetical protein
MARAPHSDSVSDAVEARPWSRSGGACAQMPRETRVPGADRATFEYRTVYAGKPLTSPRHRTAHRSDREQSLDYDRLGIGLPEAGRILPDVGLPAVGSGAPAFAAARTNPIVDPL